MNVAPSLLVGSTAHTVVLGGAGMTGPISVDSVDLSTKAFGLTLQTSGVLAFVNGGTLTLTNNATLMIVGVGGVNAGTSAPAVLIGGGAGTIDFVGVNGDIGSHGAPLLTQVSVLGGVSGTGTVYLSNTGGLTVSGVVNPGGGNGNGFISAHSPLTVSADITVAGGFTLSADTGDLTVDSGATVSSTTGGTINLVVTTSGNIVINDGHVASTNGGANSDDSGEYHDHVGERGGGEWRGNDGRGGGYRADEFECDGGNGEPDGGAQRADDDVGCVGDEHCADGDDGEYHAGQASDVTSSEWQCGADGEHDDRADEFERDGGDGDGEILSAGGDVTLNTSTATGGTIDLASTAGNVTLNSSNVLTKRGAGTWR